MHPLLHRWFVQYNPIYLVSAMLVLAGMILTSRGLAHEGSLHGFIAVAAIAEVYALALIGGAALLVRIGQRRPAVMLAMLTVLYQSDLTLHTEACANLGTIGVIAGLAWLVLFAVKLRLLAWALRIGIEKRAFATALVGATGLVALPHVLAHADRTVTGGAVALFVFALGSIAPLEGSITSRVPLDEWGHTVLRRAARVTWILWAVLLGSHILFWSMSHPLIVRAVLPALPFVLLRTIRTEGRFWIAVSTLLVLIGVLAPNGLSPCALLASLSLVQRAFSRGHFVRATVTTTATSPYRAREEGELAQQTASTYMPRTPAERARLFSGALVGLYLFVWLFGWNGRSVPEHFFPLDIAFGIGALALMWRMRARLILVPLMLIAGHGVLVNDLVPLPQSMVGQGAVAVALGFVLLAGSLVTSYRLRHTSQAMAPTTRTAPP